MLSLLIERIEPLTEEEMADGTGGQWIELPFHSMEEQIAFYGRTGDDCDQYPGYLKLKDNDDLTVEEVAHEFGHAFTSGNDLWDRGGVPTEEWKYEACADMHAVRWGLMTIEHIAARHSNNVEAAQQIGPSDDPAWFHHGPVPGGDWVEFGGKRWRLTKDFVFEVVDG